jgi:hypothetical protein
MCSRRSSQALLRRRPSSYRFPSLSLDPTVLLQNVIPEERLAKPFQIAEDLVTFIGEVEKNSDEIASAPCQHQLPHATELPQLLQEPRAAATTPWENHDCLFHRNGKVALIDQHPIPHSMFRPCRRTIGSIAPHSSSEGTQPGVAVSAARADTGEPARNVSRERSRTLRLGGGSDRCPGHHPDNEEISSLSMTRVGWFDESAVR